MQFAQRYTLQTLMVLMLACCLLLSIFRWMGAERSMQIVGLAYILAPTIAFCVSCIFHKESASTRRTVSLVTMAVITFNAFFLALLLLDPEESVTLAILVMTWVPQFLVLSIATQFWRARRA